MELASPVHDLIALMGWCKERGEEPPSADSCFNTIANVDGDCVSKVGDPHQKGPVAMHAPRTTAHFQGAAHEAQAFLDGVPSRLSGHPEDVADMARAFTPSTQEQQHAQMVRTLYVRAMRGTAEELGALLQAHPEMADSPDRGGRTLLHYAAAEGRLANVQLLLQRGANVNRKDVMGQTPLHCAVEDGHADVVRLLASTPDCDVNMVNNRSFTPLHTACLGPGNLEMAQALVAAGAKTGATNMGGFCALHFACASGNFELVDYLINEAKVDPHPRSGNRALNTPLDAVERAPQGEGKEKIKALLLSLPPPSFESRV
jgi:ankyrin repeat protein